MQIFGHTNGSIAQLANRLQDCPVRLRWGGPQVPQAINGQVHLLNGLEQLETLKTAGVPCVEFSRQYMPQVDGWLGRKLNHSQGKDIVTRAKLKQFVNRDYWTKYQESRREWRFHILNGHSIARGLKVWAGAGPEPIDPPIIRSRRLGWHLRHDVDPPKGLRATARAAVKACGYDLGAVDLLELADGSPCVLECNSRPATRDEYTLGCYERAFKAYHLQAH